MTIDEFGDELVFERANSTTNTSLLVSFVPMVITALGSTLPVIGVNELVDDYGSDTTNVAAITESLVDSHELVAALNNVVDHLLRSQIQLDADALRALNERQWELFV